jgi:hypothetical protein
MLIKTKITNEGAYAIFEEDDHYTLRKENLDSVYFKVGLLTFKPEEETIKVVKSDARNLWEMLVKEEGFKRVKNGKRLVEVFDILTDEQEERLSEKIDELVVELGEELEEDAGKLVLKEMKEKTKQVQNWRKVYTENFDYIENYVIDEPLYHFHKKDDDEET